MFVLAAYGILIPMAKMTLSEELTWRGFVNQMTFKDIKELDARKLTFYHGFDASADSQAVGNLAAMMFDKVFIRHGYKAVLVAGGSTSLIGDPGGKDSERTLQSEETIAHNVERAKKQLEKIFADDPFTMVNNLDWTKKMTVIEYLRDIGKHFSMTPLIQRDYIASRIGEDGSGMSYAEFSYTLLQGLDYQYLYDTYGVTLQLGGSDQWGNCLSGVDLIRRTRGVETHVVTLPLVINKATGKKFGKSEDGAIWLDPSKTSVYQFYQFWLNIDDAGVGDYLKVYTMIDREEHAKVMTEFEADRAGRLAQKTLAYEVTKVVHGKAAADSVKRLSETLFSGTDYSHLKAADFSLLKAELPNVKVKPGSSLIDALVATKLASSKGEARRFLESNAIYINGQQIPLNKDRLDATDAIAGHVVLRRGRNVMAVLELH